MKESIVELLGQLPPSAMVGRTYNGYKGGWMCCSYYQPIRDYGLSDAVPSLQTHDFFPVGYGTTPEEAIKDSIRQLEIGY
jgi:hypothetical protein